MAQGKRRVRWTRAEADSVLAAWRSSKLSLLEFCRKEGVGYERLRRWQRKSEDTGPSFASVEIAPAAAARASNICIELRSGVRLVVPEAYDPSALARLVCALESRAC